jgi:hypothetical protein
MELPLPGSGTTALQQPVEGTCTSCAGRAKSVGGIASASHRPKQEDHQADHCWKGADAALRHNKLSIATQVILKRFLMTKWNAHMPIMI